MARVDYIAHMGDDNMVVDAARVSFDKQHDNYTDEQNTKLINYLRKHGHWSPFSHCMVQFRITAPIYVARQLFKHQIGLSVNEISRRYVDYTPTFDRPWIWRSSPKNKKQGSDSDLPEDVQVTANTLVTKHLQQARSLYQTLIDLDVAPEQARIVLPVCTNTSWIWTGTLEAWLRICQLRLATDAQHETREVATHIANHIQRLFPASWKATFTPE